jgi:hypothetical protein
VTAVVSCHLVPAHRICLFDPNVCDIPEVVYLPEPADQWVRTRPNLVFAQQVPSAQKVGILPKESPRGVCP